MKTTKTKMIGLPGNKMNNQYVIETDTEQIFQSYNSIIVRRPKGDGKIQLDSMYWNYSQTTAKYRNLFLGMNKKEIEERIKSGEFELVNLN